MQKHYCLYRACRKADGTAKLGDYLRFSQDTDICQASDLSLPRARRLFQQNLADNHQVRLNLIKRGGSLPRLIKFRVCCLKQCSLWGKGILLAAGMEVGDGLPGVTTKPGRPGGEQRRLEDARGRQVNLWKKPWNQGCNTHFSARLKSLMLLIKSLKYLKKKCFQGSGSL